ncbi:MAG: GspE/PulE/PilB domain-containing protein [Planctomycetota bacterium]|jgi:type IV pilus assembly protein PilB
MASHALIGELLVAAKVVTEGQVAEALDTQRAEGALLGRILTEAGTCAPEDVRAALGEQLRITGVDLGRIAPQPEALRLVPRDVCRRLRMLPFEVLGEWLCAATVNVIGRKGPAEVQRMTGLKVKAFKTTYDEVVAAIDRHYPED